MPARIINFKVYFTTIEMQVKTTYQRSSSLAQIEAELLSYCGENMKTRRKSTSPASHHKATLVPMLEWYD